MNQEDAPWAGNGKDTNPCYDKLIYPEYYKKPFHAYADGNLSYDAAFEQELAVCVVRYMLCLCMLLYMFACVVSHIISNSIQQ